MLISLLLFGYKLIPAEDGPRYYHSPESQMTQNYECFIQSVSSLTIVIVIQFRDLNTP